MGAVDRAQASDDADPLLDLVSPGTRDAPLAPVPLSMPSRSAVPLPTGFSLFGAALLMLGLSGVLAGARSRPAAETGSPAEAEQGSARAAAPPALWFKIEVRSERGYQVRHTGSARSALDLIADLLNEGWEMVGIRDRNGLPLDYEDVIHAWGNERPGR